MLASPLMILHLHAVSAAAVAADNTRLQVKGLSYGMGTTFVHMSDLANSSL